MWTSSIGVDVAFIDTKDLSHEDDHIIVPGEIIVRKNASPIIERYVFLTRRLALSWSSKDNSSSVIQAGLFMRAWCWCVGSTIPLASLAHAIGIISIAMLSLPFSILGELFNVFGADLRWKQHWSWTWSFPFAVLKRGLLSLPPKPNEEGIVARGSRIIRVC